jgi:hypothetical protein
MTARQIGGNFQALSARSKVRIVFHRHLETRREGFSSSLTEESAMAAEPSRRCRIYGKITVCCGCHLRRPYRVRPRGL